MRRSESVFGLDPFGLSKSDFRHLANTEVRITAHIDSYKLTPAVVRRPAEDRLGFLELRSRRQVKSLEKKWPSKSFSPEAMVRWKLEKIVDVYATWETKIDPNGTEVFSSLHERRMKKEYEWRT